MTLLATSLGSLPDQGPGAAQGSIAFVRDILGRLERELTDEPRWVAITVPAPVAPLEVVACADATGMLWDPPAGPRFAGAGSAAVLEAWGGRRIAELEQRAAALWSRIELVSQPGVEPVRPRLFGGFAFAPGAASAAPWSGFGDARFVLPRWLYQEHGGRASLSLCVDVHALGVREPMRVVAELERMMALLSRAEVREDEVRDERVVATGEIDPAAWRRQIEDIRAAIAAGRCDKIVAARCTLVTLARAADTAAVLRTLDRRYADCYRFAFGFGGARFVGATPERLIARDGERVFTEALAGSIAASPDGDRQASAALLASRKDRSEQDFVVQSIASALGPLCRELDVPAEPVIRVLRHVLHLKTPIQGILREPVHVLDLVEALHPTPAVGGVPTATAMAWIAEHEQAPRGWYAAPVGWFDAGGQGEFAVAIRSGLLAGNQAHIYAGAGIVRDSDPDAEFAETRLKQRAVLDALGVKA